jgi:hypothetical protein
MPANAVQEHDLAKVRGRGFESLRPLQDLIDLTTVGKCTRGNVWGNSAHITNAFW